MRQTQLYGMRQLTASIRTVRDNTIRIADNDSNIDQRTQITVVCGLRASDAVGHLDEFSQHRIHLLLMRTL